MKYFKRFIHFNSLNFIGREVNNYILLTLLQYYHYNIPNFLNKWALINKSHLQILSNIFMVNYFQSIEI